MKLVSMMMCVALCAAAGASHATERGDAQARGRGMLAPPAPPVPPAPPTAPIAPVAPISPVAPIAPVAPIPPVPPMEAVAPLAPPPPPPLPAIPDAAHNACAGKAVGSKMSLNPRRGMTMRGTCEKDAKGMYFELSEYRDSN